MRKPKQAVPERSSPRQTEDKIHILGMQSPSPLGPAGSLQEPVQEPQQQGQAEPIQASQPAPGEDTEAGLTPVGSTDTAANVAAAYQPEKGEPPAQINHGDLFAEPLETLTSLGQDEYTELRLCGRRMVEHYWLFGRIATAIKTKVGHGAFGEFCVAQGWDQNWVRRSLRIFHKNPTLEDCRDMSVIEACHYEHVVGDEGEEEPPQPTTVAGAAPTTLEVPTGNVAAGGDEEEGEHEDEDLDEDKELDEDDEDHDEESDGGSTSDNKSQASGTPYDPPKWMLHWDGSIHPINRETKDRYHNDKGERGERSFSKEDGSLFATKAEAAAEYMKRVAQAPKFANCERVLPAEERKNHPYSYGKGYILNDGTVVQVGTFRPPGVVNAIWYTWDGANIAKADRAVIANELYGISREKIPEPDMSQKAKLLVDHKTFELVVTLAGTVRLTGVDEDDAKKILDAGWKELVRSITFNECEAVDVHEVLAKEEAKEHDDPDEEVPASQVAAEAASTDALTDGQ